MRNWESGRVRQRCSCFFFQAEDGIRDLVRSRGLGDVYKRQVLEGLRRLIAHEGIAPTDIGQVIHGTTLVANALICLLYTSDAADDRSSVDLGGRRIIKKKPLIATHSGAFLQSCHTLHTPFNTSLSSGVSPYSLSDTT